MSGSRLLHSTRLLLVALLTLNLAALALIVAIAVRGVDHITSNEALEFTRGVGQLEPGYRMIISQREQMLAMNGYLLTGSQRQLRALRTAGWEYDRAFAQLDALHHDAFEEQLFPRLVALDHQDDTQEARIIALYQGGKHAAAVHLFLGEQRAVKEQLTRSLNQMIDKQERDVAKLHRDVIHVEHNIKYWISLCALALIPTCLLLIWRVYRRVIRPLQDLEAAARAIGDGHDAVRIPLERDDEFGSAARAFNRMAGEIEATLQRLKAANEALAEQADELRVLDRYKDEFLAVVSHELRTPINYIKGFASLLAKEYVGPLNEEQAQYLENVLAASERMLLLVNDLLDGATIQAGKLSILPEPTDYSALIAEVVAHMRPLFDEKRLAIATQIHVPGVCSLDHQRVGQVIMNLATNAIKFTPAGGQIRIEAREEAGQLVTLVSDTGPGIRSEDFPRLFQRFGQLDMSTTRRAGGTGLGLWICRAIVEAHGGQISLETQLGVGSTFRFVLPLAAEGSEEARSGLSR